MHNIFQRHPKLTIMITFSILLVIILCTIEIILRYFGFLPGTAFFRYVDKLVVYDTFYADCNGILRANQDSKRWNFPYQINSDGFRSPEFKKGNGNKLSILIIGDSFAWGKSANPITNCFADLIRNEGYDVFNAGIPAVGPTQYLAIAKIYIPKLKPDYVIISLFLGNDLLEKPDPMLPYHNLFFETNAGMIKGYDEKNNPLSAQDSYYYYIYNPHIKRSFKTILKMFLNKSSIGTLLLNSGNNFRTKINNYTNKLSSNTIKYNYTWKTLFEIKKYQIPAILSFTCW
jgi:hypothetical protein